jgi:hypothetical protein
MSNNQISISSILKNHELRIRSIEENYKQLKGNNDTNVNETNNSTNNDKLELLSLMLKENKEATDNMINSLLEKYNRINELFSLQYLEITRLKKEFSENNNIVLDIQEKEITNEVNESAKIDYKDKEIIKKNEDTNVTEHPEDIYEEDAGGLGNLFDDNSDENNVENKESIESKENKENKESNDIYLTEK